MASEVPFGGIFRQMCENFGRAVDVRPVLEWQARSVLLVEDGNHGNDRPRRDEFCETGTPFVRPPNLKNGRIRFSECDRINRVAVNRVRKGVGRGGDVVLTHRATVGRLAFVPEDGPDFVTNPGTTVYRSTNRGVIDNRYLYWLMCSHYFQDQLHALSGDNSTFPYVALTQQRKLLIPAPPLPEQRRIAHVLGVLDDKIELNRKMNRTLEAMAQALFKSWFIDFDGVRPEDLVDSELGPIPKGWSTQLVAELALELETGSRPKGGVGNITAGIPSIGAESISGVGRFDFDKTKFVPLEFFSRLRKGVLKSHDILLYKDGGKPGDFRPKVGMFGDGFPFEQCAVNSHVYRLRLRPPLTQEYGYFWFSSEPAMLEMRRLGTGVAIPSLPRRNLLGMRILVPDESALRRFNDMASLSVTRILSNAAQSRTLADLRDTLLPKLISGEIRVPEAVEAVEAAGA